MALLLAGLAVLGLAVGSFLTVVVRRLGTGKTILWGRSQCIHCGTNLRWFELVPALSFFIQRGRCRQCGAAIPRTYPLLELITALVFAVLGWATLSGTLPPPAVLAGLSGALPPTSWRALGGTFLYYAFFAAAGIAISFYDFQRRLIPSALTLPLAAVGLGDKIVQALSSADVTHLVLTVATAAGAFLLFWSLWRFSTGRVMGRGDADVALTIGLYLGPRTALLGMLFAFWLGAIVGSVLVLGRRLRWRSQIPFAPFLFGGALVALFVAERAPMVQSLWYTSAAVLSPGGF